MRRRSTIQRLSAVAVAAAGTIVAGLLAAPPAYAADVTHTIAAVQGTNAAMSPLVGQVVTVEGIVTGDHRTGGFRGLYLQTAGSGGSTDATPNASDGIFIFLSANPASGVAIGDRIKATGAVSEFSGVTQITASAVGSIELVQAGVGVPALTALPATVLGSAREAFEGMLVRPERHLPPRLQPQPAELRRALDERRQRDARRGVRDAGAAHGCGDRHHDRQHQRPPAPRRRLQRPRRRPDARRRPALLHQGRRRPQRRRRHLPRGRDRS